MKLQILTVWTLVAATLLAGKADGQPTPSASYYDLTLPRRFQLGVNYLFRPRSLAGLGLGYKAIITTENEQELCRKVSDGRGVVGVPRGDVVLVPYNAGVILCTPGNIFVGQDPTDGDPVISWELDRR